SKASRTWTTAGVALGLLSAAAAVAFAVLLTGKGNNPNQGQFANQKPPAVAGPNEANSAASANQIANSPPRAPDRTPLPDRAPGNVQPTDRLPGGDSPDSAPAELANSRPTIGPDSPLAPPRYGNPSPTGEVISFVNAELSQGWTENDVAPAP